MGQKNVARLSAEGNYSFFSLGDDCIRFRTSDKLKRYVRVKEWDHGYLVVDVDYETLGITEDYIDLNSILEDLYVDAKEYLETVEEVVI